MLPVLKILRAHGINGSVHVFLYDAIAKGQNLQDESLRIFCVRSFSLKEKGFAVVAFHDILDRNTAELLRGTVLYKEKESLEGSDYYLSELIGRDININQSSETCKIKNVLNYGAGDILELSYNGQDILIPFRHEFFSTNRELSIDYSVLKSFLM